MKILGHFHNVYDTSIEQKADMKFKFFIFLAICCALFAMLWGRLSDVQIFQGSSFRLQADDNRFFTLPLSAERGVFLDRFGQPLVWNTRRYFRVIDPEKIHYSKLPIEREAALALMATESGSVVSSLDRLYRFPQALAHILGFVGAVTVENLENDRSLALSDQVGRLGLELSQNALLRGADGKEMYEINALGKRQKKVNEIAARPGQTVATSLDPYLSEVAYRALQNKKGAVVILDAQTGKVISLVSSPSYDPNILTKTGGDPETEKARQAAIRSLFTDERQVFFNRAVDGMYPPGSVFKIVTALAGLEYQKLDAATTVTDEGILRVGDFEYGNWFYRQYGRTEGSISLVRAIARSNDIYFYKAAEWVGPDKLAEMSRMLGYGQKSTLEISSQARGLIPTPAWKEEKLGERWYLGNTYHFGIGQGDVLVSPLQVAQMTQTVANNGVLCSPSLLQEKPKHCTELSLKTENVDLVLRGMLDACSAGGTAYPFFPYNESRRLAEATVESDLARGAVACKTGTAEFGAADIQDRRRTHGWFTALVHLEPEQLLNAEALIPQTQTITGESDLRTLRQAWLEALIQQPLPQRLVFVALVESDEEQPFREGSRDAAPVVKSIVDWMVGDFSSETPVVGEGE